MNTGFEHPLMILLGAAFIPLLIFLSSRFRNPFTLSLPLGAPGGIPFKPPLKGEFLIKILKILELCGVFILFLAAAGPVVKVSERVWLNRGADILFVLDISPSMAGIDMDGRSRFDAARDLVRSFAENRPSDAVGLCAVGYDAALLAPPTVDRRALFSRLENLRVAELGDGTALGMGLATAAFHLQNSAAPRRAAVLITDGENNAGAIHPETAAAMLKETGISLWVVGVGSGGEVPIDYVDPVTRMRRTGTFDSRFDPESLLALSRAGGGTYIAAPSGEALAAAFSRIAAGEMTVSRSGNLIRRSPRHVPFIIAAMVIFVGSALIRRYLLGTRKYRNILPLFAEGKKLRFRYRCSRCFFALFLVCLVIALSNPHWGSRIVTEYRRGLDAVLALDVSRSMEVRDLPDLPFSRLERELEIGRLLAENAAGIRLGAAVSRGRGILSVPLTDDTEAVTGFLGGLDGSVFSGGRGTNLEALVDAAASAFLNSLPTRRVIILISDGETLTGSLSDAIDRAVAADITLVVIGIGTEEGGPVPAAEPSAEPFVSYRRTEVLQNTAKQGRGFYVDGNREDAAITVLKALQSLAADSGTGGSRREPTPRWDIFIILALISLGISKRCLLESRRRSARALLIPLSLSLFLLGGCSRIPGRLLIMEGNFYHAQGRHTEAVAAYLRAIPNDPVRPYAEYGLGAAYIALDEGDAALERFEASAEALKEQHEETGKELSYRLSYNRGIVLFEKGNYGGAADAFKQALEIDGSRIEAKRNLELSLLSLSREASSAGTATAGASSREDEGNKPPERASALFDYLRQKEQNQWKSREWIEEEASTGPDY
ncbi:hypothetical protein FACS189491_03760 [Spirochaetia bacterium]|nr:hypothetical protein FACS189491_03760 [Spirochaetia bacterium]